MLDVKAGTTPPEAHDALAQVFKRVDELRSGFAPDLGVRRDETKSLYEAADVLLGVGRRLFDTDLHDPPLTEQQRPSFLAYLDQRHPAFPAIPWDRDPPANGGEADVALQLTGPSEASVNCMMVEIYKLLHDEQLPLVVAGAFTGFGRPDGRGWLDFHDGVSNIEAHHRLTAIAAPADHGWMRHGTYMAFLRFTIDLDRWRAIPPSAQELLVGRDKVTGHPLGADPDDPTAFRDPPETTSPELTVSHLHRANQSRACPVAPGALRIFRQGYDFLDEITGDGPRLGLNFVSFQSDLAILQHLMHQPGWLADVNFGGYAGPDSPQFITLADGGLYAIPPRDGPFPGAQLFASTRERIP